MDRYTNRVGWVQMKYERAEDRPSVTQPPPAASAPAPRQPVPYISMPKRPSVSLSGDDWGGMALDMSYVKMQKWDETYEPETALERGTIFPELDLPFVGEGACPHDE